MGPGATFLAPPRRPIRFKQVGRQVRVRVSYTDQLGGVESNRTSSATPSIIASNPAGNNAGIVSLSGDPTQNQVLAANVTDVDGLTSATSIRYQWQQSSNGGTIWSDISGATSKALTLVQAQAGTVVHAVVTYVDAGGMPESVTSAATSAVINVNDPGVVAITGTPVQGQVLQATVIDPDGLNNVSISYRWQQLVSGAWSDIANATAATLTLQPAQVGRQVRVIASYSDQLGIVETNRTSQATPSVVSGANNHPGVLSISGTTAQNQTLTATVSDVDGVPASVVYQWQQSASGSSPWSNISGATASTLILGQAQVGSFVRASASYTDILGSSESPASTATATAVANVNDGGAVTINGTAAQNQVLTASVADLDGVPANIAYHWQSSANGSTWTDLATVTTSSLTLDSSLVGQRVRVNATYTDLLGAGENVTSAATAPVAAVNSSARSLFTTQVPALPNFTDGPGVDWELGMNFTSDNPGVIQAIRYYKSPSETGTHVGRIWSATGQQLATVTFTNESASGWQQQALATPLTINAATSYVVSVNTNSYYALTSQGFSAAISNAGLNAPVGAGVYNDVGGVFPTLVYQNENYFRDVVFVTGSSNANNHPGVLSISGTAAQNQTLTATVSDVDGVPASVLYQWQQSANGSTWSNINGATASTLILGQSQGGSFVRASASYTDIRGSSESPASPATATAVANANDRGAVTINGTTAQNQVLTASVADLDGVPANITYHWQSSANGSTWTDLAAVTTSSLTLDSSLVGQRVRVNATYTDLLGASENVTSAATAPVAAVNSSARSLFTTQVPALPNFTDGPGVDWELGMRFTSDNPGVIQAIRYYKSPSETGAHVGRIWSATGQQLATVTFTNESASGWQQQALATPLTINAATSYVVSVNTNSYYALTSQGFSSAISNAGLNAPVGAGVYNDVAGVFPTLVYQNENYFRDVVFVTGSSNANNHPGVLSISGTAAQNQTLTATVSDVDGVPASVLYQWQQSANGSTWSNINGATASTLILGQSQVGSFVRASASYTDILGSSESPASTATATAVANVNDGGAVTINGTAAQNQVLTASVADLDGVPANIAYHWQSSANGSTWTDLATVTTSSLTLDSSLVGQRVRVNATYTDLLGAGENVTSAATAPVAAVNSSARSLFTTQ